MGKWWKNRPYWQKGGLIKLIILLFGLIFIQTTNALDAIVYYNDVPDLVPISIGFSNTMPSVGEEISIVIVLENRGITTSNSFEVDFYENSNGKNRLIGTKLVSGLEKMRYTKLVKGPRGEAWTDPVGLKEVSINWTPNSPGNYYFQIIVDPENKIKEANETNNGYGYIKEGDEQNVKYITVFGKGPKAEITNPENGAVFREDEVIAFSGRGTDFKEGWLDESKFEWKSDKSGFLGNGEGIIINEEGMLKQYEEYYKNITLTQKQKEELEKYKKEASGRSKKLSKGIHKISLTVKNSKGDENTDYVIIGIYGEGENPIKIDTIQLPPPKINIKEKNKNFFEIILSLFSQDKFKVYSISWDKIPNAEYYQYDLDTQGWEKTKDNNIRLKISNEGIHTISVRSVNKFEIAGQEKIETIYIDNI